MCKCTKYLHVGKLMVFIKFVQRDLLHKEKGKRSHISIYHHHHFSLFLSLGENSTLLKMRESNVPYTTTLAHDVLVEYSRFSEDWLPRLKRPVSSTILDRARKEE